MYITPPKEREVIDRYFEMGADRIACSLEVWDDRLAEVITPGKREFTTKRRHLDALTYIAEKYGLEPAGGCGLNVCVEWDIYRWATGAACC